ncbi:MAG: hypothetical protein P4L41_16550 [Flavipsychrobacter sp.]|nr:hypothetical protein [Flavipsychrobacter sp.]
MQHTSDPTRLVAYSASFARIVQGGNGDYANKRIGVSAVYALTPSIRID